MNMQRWCAGVALVCAGHLAACDDAKEALLDRFAGDEGASLGVLAMHQGSLDVALLAALTVNVSLDGDEEDVIAGVEEGLENVLIPASCVQSVRTGSSLTLTFDGCSTRYGVQGVRGVANLNISDVTLGNAGFNFSAAGLELNGYTLVIGLLGSFSDTDGVRTWDLATAGGGVTADREAVTRGGAITARTDDACLLLRGGFNVSVAENLFVSLFNDFTRCDNPCPSAGTMLLGETEVEIEEFEFDLSLDGDVLTMTFVGSEQVAWVNREGRAGVVTLTCSE